MLTQWLIEPWSWGAWMWRGMLAVTLVSVNCALLGVFLYLRRMSLIADALAHVALLGIVAAFLMTGSLGATVMLIGAALVGFIAAVGIETLSMRPKVRADAAIGIIFTAFFALGVILISTRVQDAHIDVNCVLFGDVLGISDRTLIMLGMLTPMVLLFVGVFYRWLAVSSFDTAMAIGLGIPVIGLHYGLMTIVSMTTVASFEAVGAILVIALIIVPAATAHILTNRLIPMLMMAVLTGIVSSVVGMYLAIWLNASAAGSIVVVSGIIYMTTFIFAPRHGVAWRIRRRKDAHSVLS